MLLLVLTRGMVTPIARVNNRVEAKNAPKHSAVYRTASHTKLTWAILIVLRLRNGFRNLEGKPLWEGKIGKFHQGTVFFHELLTWLHLEKHSINKVTEKGISIVYLGNSEKPGAAGVEGLTYQIES